MRKGKYSSVPFEGGDMVNPTVKDKPTSLLVSPEMAKALESAAPTLFRRGPDFEATFQRIHAKILADMRLTPREE